MTSDALFEGIACQSTEHGIRLLDVGHETNHWVGCVQADLGAGVGVGVSPGSDAGLTFHAVYLSLSRVVCATVSDGDCGLDLMCLMSGAPRTLATRRAFRQELSAFLITHAGN